MKYDRANFQTQDQRDAFRARFGKYASKVQFPHLTIDAKTLERATKVHRLFIAGATVGEREAAANRLNAIAAGANISFAELIAQIA